jgi:uncharacterized membrane protein YphA (DoxX/SURF4 family)
LGTLLLRAALGSIAAAQGAVYLAHPGEPALGWWGIGLLMVVSGACLLIGLLTPIASAVVGMSTAGVALSWIASPVPNLLHDKLAILLVVIVAVAVGCLGPGAFSVDSYLFGRREIVIPPVSRAPKY